MRPWKPIFAVTIWYLFGPYFSMPYLRAILIMASFASVPEFWKKILSMPIVSQTFSASSACGMVYG